MSLYTSLKAAVIHPFFNEKRYLRANPDAAEAGIDAWTHYKTIGIPENRPAFPLQYHPYGVWYNLLRQYYRIKYRNRIARHQDKRILVHAHLYYMEAWCEMAEYLRNLEPYNCDFVVTYTAERKEDDVIAAVEKSFKGIKVIPCANKGFDIGPFFEVLRDVNLDDYAIVYHVHSKSFSKGLRISYGKAFEGKEWFEQMYSAIMGVKKVHKCIDLICNSDDVGMVGAKNVFFDDMPERARLVKEFAKRYGVSVPNRYKFVGGTCFASSAAALKAIQAWGITLDSFEESARKIFTLAHAVERLIPIEMENQGFHHRPIKVSCKKHRKELEAREAKINKKIATVIKILRKHGFTGLRPLHMDVKSGLRCSFFRGIYNGQECFIKWGGMSEACANEAKMMELTAPLSPYFQPVIAHAEKKKYRFIASPMLHGFDANQMIQFGLAKEDCENICTALDEIQEVLKANRLLHRDIRPLNVFYTEDKKTYLIDLQFMVQLDENGHFEEFEILKEHEQRRLHLGADFQKGPGEWDDAFSIAKTKEVLRQHCM